MGFGVGPVDDRLAPKALVYGPTIGGASVAYPESVVRTDTVINDHVGEVPVLVVEDPQDGGIAAFVRRVDNRTLTFHLANGTLVDEAGNRWSFDGDALSGPHAGSRLDRLNTHGFFWFAWSRFHPETAVYNASDSRQTATG